jgi:REP element-mobilizing transposase RayT
VVIELLRDLWSDPANAWLIGDFLLMPDHLHFFVTPKDGPWVMSSAGRRSGRIVSRSVAGILRGAGSAACFIIV